MKLPNIKGYANNVLKEARQVGSSYLSTIDAQTNARSYPSNDMAKDGKGREYWGQVANQRSAKTRKEEGQLAGAILQGRRYSDKTGKQIKKAGK